MDDIEEFLEREPDEVKEAVRESGSSLEDISELIAAEAEGAARDELLSWLEAKKARLAVIGDEERVREALSHLEYAYRTAAISEEAYRTAKARNRELLGDNDG